MYRDADDEFGQLASEQFRAVRLVVDTGMHAMGWSRDRAREYFALHVPGQSMAEIDRYIAWPGQALAYKIGRVADQGAARRAPSRQLGPGSTSATSTTSSCERPLPLDLLEEQVTAYIARRDSAVDSAVNKFRRARIAEAISAKCRSLVYSRSRQVGGFLTKNSGTLQAQFRESATIFVAEHGFCQEEPRL